MSDGKSKSFPFISGRLIYAILVVFIVVSIAFIIIRKKQNVKTEPISLNISKGSITAGESFYSCLINDGFSSQIIYRITEALKPVYDVRICRPGDRYEIVSSTDGFFRKLLFYHNIYIYTVEKSSSNVYTADYRKVPMEEKVVGICGELKESLWLAMKSQGLSADLIMRFTDIFSWQIDFLTEPRRGDKYKLVWLRYEDSNGKAIDGKILSAMYEGKESGGYTALIYDNKYYDLEGKSLHKQFLRAPLNFRRISSYFSRRRFHPILKKYRPHEGIDYAAPKGTPVVSIGDGTVVHCGWKGGYGKTIMVKHNSIYTSLYGHLSRYGKGIRKGRKVKQGKVIGHVGSTGLSTGPHLDFRIKKYGKSVNFLKLKIPPSKRIDSWKMEEYEKTKKDRLAQLARAFRRSIEVVSE